MRPRALSAVKPSGRLHLGNLEGALRTWVGLQDACELFCMVADWHAYAAPPASPAIVREDARQAAIDFLAAGIDPARATVFLQSDVKEHAELALLLAGATPVAWLERVPTWKDAVAGGAQRSYGLLGYPVLQAADILLYRATIVPVGLDQLPHVELAREIARRFNRLYGEVLAEPEALLSPAPDVPGIDGRKMSKSYGNTIALGDGAEETAAKIERAFTTPSKVRASDPGEPERCAVCRWRRIYDPEGWPRSWEEDREGRRGCLQNKRELAPIMDRALAPIRERRRALERDRAGLARILADGAERARRAAAATMAEVRRAMGLG